MLSLPLLPPRDDHILWPSSSSHNSLTGSPSPSGPTSTSDFAHNPTTSHHHPSHQHPTHPSRRPTTSATSLRSPLALLVADENTIVQRKQNVRRFGAGWLRPPGVPKTYQAAMDEAAEREEQEVLARREAAMLEMAGAADAAAAEAAAVAAEGMGRVGEEGSEDGEEEGVEGEGERDLDDDVPDAEDLVFNDESMMDGSSLLGGGARESGLGLQTDGAGDVSAGFEIADDGASSGSDVAAILAMEEAEMVGRLQDERDLDDDVPDAGSYQHTDTDVEDSSSEPEVGLVEIDRRSLGLRVGIRTPGGDAGEVVREVERGSVRARRAQGVRERAVQMRRRLRGEE